VDYAFGCRNECGFDVIYVQSFLSITTHLLSNKVLLEIILCQLLFIVGIRGKVNR